MNRTTALLLGGLAIVSLTTVAYAINNPIPGVDIIVEKNPGGSAIRTLTGRDGRFVIEGLTAGSYSIRVAASTDMPRTAAQAAMHGRSSIKPPTSAIVRGVQVVTIVAESGEGPAETKFTITAQRGRVVGLVTRAVAAPR